MKKSIFSIKNLLCISFFFVSMNILNTYSVKYLDISHIGSFEILFVGILIIYFLKEEKKNTRKINKRI